MKPLTQVLIVDDKPENLYLLRVLLASRDYQVAEAINGKDALELARRNPPDLIISDILMPVMDGFALCRQWQNDTQLHNIPFVFYTATYTEARDRDFALSLGAECFLVKPLEPQIFLQEIDQVLTADMQSKSASIKENELEGEEFYRQYNVRLVHKLEDKLTEIEQKNIQLESKKQELHAANTKLEEQNQALEDELKRNQEINNELIVSEKIIQKNAHELDLIINNLVESVFLLDKNLDIINNNQAAENMFGYSKKQLQGLNLKALVPDLKWPQKNTNDNKFQGQHKDNTQLSLHTSIIKSPEENNEQFICSCLDITYQLQQEEHLRRSQKMQALGKLTGGIAHDFNNMLSVILGFADILNLELKDNSTLTGYIYRISQAGERAKKLVTKLLAFSKQNTIDAQHTDINQLLLEEQHLIEKMLTARITLKLNLDKQLWPAWIDPGSLEDAVLNICINAMHAMPEGGNLTISSRNEKILNNKIAGFDINSSDYTVLSFHDNGCGMSPETQQKIFDPFYTTKGDAGTGLGMSQVYGFVQQSNGAIRVTSDLNKGSTIELYFPRDIKISNNETIPTTVNNNENHELLSNKHILVVDDEAGIRELSKIFLSRHDFRVSLADSAASALEILKSSAIDMMISDVIMPNMNGYQLADIVHQEFPHIKIVMISGFNDEDTLSEHNELNNPQIQKPFSSKELLDIVHDELGD